LKSKDFDDFLAAITPELSKENSNSKHRVDKKELTVHMDNSMYHNERKIQEHFARKNMTRIRHPGYSPDLSLLVLMVLRLCQRATERPTNHGQE
jgi:hypothetical protein